MILRFKKFISEDLLIENRIEFLKTQHPTLDTSHDELAKYKDAGAIIDHFAKKADPTPTKAHTQWIVNQYKRKQIRQEDAPQIKSTLKDFNDVKERLEKKDLNQYKDLGELRDAVATQKAQVVKATKAKKTAAENKMADLEKMYDSEGVTGYKIPNKESSIRNYGPAGVTKPTHWCTAANSSENMFNSYKGGKYTMHFPNGEVLQFHHQSDQIMDKHDRPINESDPRFQPYEHHISKFIHQTRGSEKNSKITRFAHFEPHEIDSAINNYKKSLAVRDNDPSAMKYSANHEALSKIAAHAKLSDEHFNTMHSLPTAKVFGSVEGIPPFLSGNKKLTHEQVGTLLKSEGDLAKEHHQKLLYNPAVKGEHIDALMNSPHLSERSKKDLVDNPHLETRHIDHFIQDPTNHEGLAKNHAITLTPEHQRAITGSNSWSGNAGARRDLHQDTINHFLGSNSAELHKQLLNNEHVDLSDKQIRDLHMRTSQDHATAGHIFNSPKTSPETREWVFNTHLDKLGKGETGNDSLHHMISSPHFTKGHLDKVLDAADNGKDTQYMRYLAARYHKASQPQLDRQVDHAASTKSFRFPAVDALLSNKNLKPHHLKKLFDTVSGTTAEHHVDSIMNHSSTNADVLHHVFDNGHNWNKTAVLHHPSVQSSHFSKAMDMEGMKLHGAISSAPSAPPSALKKLADSPLSFIRHNVASHKNTPSETLAKLAQDSEEEIAETAKKRLKVK